MGALVIKNFPEDLHAALRARAERHRRSVTREVVMLIENALSGGPRVAPELPPPVRLRGAPITTVEIEKAAAAGRD